MMLRHLKRVLRDERGMAYVLLTAALVIGTLGFAAIAVDVGVLLTARSEATRAAEAASLAGAIEFVGVQDPADAVAPATASALQYVGMNHVRSTPVDNTAGSPSWQGSTFLQPFNEGLIEVLRDSMKVRVRVNRAAVPTIFARFVDVESWSTTGMAAAQVDFAGTARCVKPFAVPDRWFDQNHDGVINLSTGEYYKRYDPDTVGQSPPATGFGSSFRNASTYFDGSPNPWYDPNVVDDWGGRVDLRIGAPHSTPHPSMYYTWALPPDPDLASKSCPGGTMGQNTFRKNICLCNKSEIELGKVYQTETGGAGGNLRAGMNDLVKQDPDARWDPIQRKVVGSKFEPWWNSPRVATVAIFDPNQFLLEGANHSGIQPIVFNNFASIFIEELPPGSGANSDNVYGRFLPFAQGAGRAREGGTSGTLVRMLQIVE